MAWHFLAALRHRPGALIIERSGDTLVSEVELAGSSASRRRGLLGRTSLEGDRALIIAPTQGVHTFGMRFAIDVIAVNRDGVVIKMRARVMPRRLFIALRAFAIIELPERKVDRHQLRCGDRIIVSPHEKPTALSV